MFKSERVTLLVIPEAGGRTLEFKVPRFLVTVLAAVAALTLVLVAMGGKFYLETRSLERQVEGLQRENALLAEEVEQIGQLEQMLLRLQRSNQQLRVILGESAQGEGEMSSDSYAGVVDSLRWGRLRSSPGLWPVDGALLRSFSARFPAVVIAVALESPVRASAAGQVVRVGYDEELGYLVVLDHGGGLTSQYGYCSRTLVGEGDSIEKGQPVALSGRSGKAETPSLYYAISENGRPQDPVGFRLWL